MAQLHPMDLLAGGVPITLLLDLANTDHLSSRSICRHEGGGAGWLDDHVPASQSSRRRTTPSRSAHGQMSTSSTPNATRAS